MTSYKSDANLKLAWIRTLTGENADYREFQRLELDSFGWAEDENIQHLHQELNDNSYYPEKTTKVYIPKPSGLLRPITVLRAKDSIVYQGLINVLAEKARKHLSKYYLKSVYSNIVIATPGYPYFYRRWKYGRKKLDEARKRAFNQGYIWTGELDLASFYDVIDHDVLKQVLSDMHCDEDCVQLLLKCLSEWTINPFGFRHSHGLPQGPLPSSFLAECVMHSLDKKLINLKNSLYFRYVDDITLVSKNEIDLKKLLARIEISCRELGLVPQMKTRVRKLENVEEMMFPEVSLGQSIFNEPYKISDRQNKVLKKLFFSCFKNGKLNRGQIQVTSKLNYSLYRMNKDERILKKVIGLLYDTPNMVDALSYYMRKFGSDMSISDALQQYLDSGQVFDYVNARCLESYFVCCVYGRYGQLSKTCEKYLPKRYHVILRSMAVKILGQRKTKSKPLLKLLSTTDDIYLQEYLLLAICNILPDTTKQHILNKYLRSHESHLAMVSAYLLTSTNLKIEGSIADVNHWASPILVAKGVSTKRIEGDRVGQILEKRYLINISNNFSFRKIFDARQYKQAILQLNMAEGGYTTNRSLWVTHMDNFNQLMLIKIYKKLGISVTRGNEFGCLNSKSLRKKYPNIGAVFEQCHNARLSNPIPHAYSRLLGTYSHDIKPGERDKLRLALKVAYQEFIDKI